MGNGVDPLVGWLHACLLLSLRIAPVFAFAPPFTLVRLPRSFRVLLGVGLSACLLPLVPTDSLPPPTAVGDLIAGVRELLLGLVCVMVLQLGFGALYVAGRTIDIQAGYGLALLIDPTSRSQTPLVGTLMAYLAGAIFFALGGPEGVLRLFAESIQIVPIGLYRMPASIAPLAAFLGVAFTIAFGIAGLTILALFIVDVVIALLSRTVPQMNVLILGLQVKSLVMLLVLPLTLGTAGALFAQLTAAMLETIRALI